MRTKYIDQEENILAGNKIYWLTKKTILAQKGKKRNLFLHVQEAFIALLD